MGRRHTFPLLPIIGGRQCSPLNMQLSFFFSLLENLRHVACELMCNRYENVSNEVQFIDSVIAMDEWADEFKEWMSGRSNSMGYLGIAH